MPLPTLKKIVQTLLIGSVVPSNWSEPYLQQTEMCLYLLGAAILPHGSIILDPTLEDLPPGAEELHVASKYVGDYVKDHEPDIIVMATPHGINLSESIGIYASRVATGFAEWNRTWGDFKVSANINDEFSMDLYNHLQVIRLSTVRINTM